MSEPPLRRADTGERTRRDLARLRRRDRSDRSFFRALALVGSVGWPIVLLATGGALVGRTLDQRLGTGIRITLTLLFAGTVVGIVVAWRAVRGGDA